MRVGSDRSWRQTRGGYTCSGSEGAVIARLLLAGMVCCKVTYAVEHGKRLSLHQQKGTLLALTCRIFDLPVPCRFMHKPR